MDQLEFFTVPSPCVGVCTVDERGYCRGCMRKREERFNWLNFTPSQQLDIIKRCRERYLRRMGQKHDDFFEKVEEYSHQMDIDDAIQREFENTIFRGRPVDELSRKALNVLFLIIERYFFPFLLSCLATVYMEESDFIREFFRDKETVTEIRQGIEANVFDEKYKRFRIVVTHELEVREHPDKRAGINSTITLGAVIEELESDLMWVKVRYLSSDEDVETGWVEKRYTQNVRYSN